MKLSYASFTRFATAIPWAIRQNRPAAEPRPAPEHRVAPQRCGPRRPASTPAAGCTAELPPDRVHRKASSAAGERPGSTARGQRGRGRRAFRRELQWMRQETDQLAREVRVILRERKRQQKAEK